uniref:Uncharacterized protein n=1 Tax=Arundo donax TaxID=35708 RepID=A0A0A9BNQ2_ARUDO
MQFSWRVVLSSWYS